MLTRARQVNGERQVALPKSTEAPELVRLHALVDAEQRAGWADWPAVKESDYTTFGKIIVLFSYIA